MAGPGHGQFPQQMMPLGGGQQAPPYPSSGGTSQAPILGPGMQQSNMMGQMPPQSQQMLMSTSPSKEPNSILLCKCGQEYVQDIVQKVSDIFKLMQTKQMPLPNGTYSNQSFLDKRSKLEEHLTMLTNGFKKVKLIYDKVNEMSKDCEELPEETLIPLVGQPFEEKTPKANSSGYYRYKYVSDENQEFVQQLRAKNAMLKDIIDQMRTVLWEINAMLVMRKT